MPDEKKEPKKAEKKVEVKDLPAASNDLKGGARAAAQIELPFREELEEEFQLDFEPC